MIIQKNCNRNRNSGYNSYTITECNTGYCNKLIFFSKLVIFNVIKFIKRYKITTTNKFGYLLPNGLQKSNKSPIVKHGCKLDTHLEISRLLHHGFQLRNETRTTSPLIQVSDWMPAILKGPTIYVIWQQLGASWRGLSRCQLNAWVALQRGDPVLEGLLHIPPDHIPSQVHGHPHQWTFTKRMAVWNSPLKILLRPWSIW